MRCSVLDLGSNSFHVLVADLDGATLVPVEREREMLHLGQVVARHGGVPEPEVVRAESTVAHLSALARRSGTVEHLAVATSALRDADNGPDVLDRLSTAAGAPVRTLTGEEEARLAYLGVRAGVAVGAQPLLVLDLGGGSLELAVGSDGAVGWSTSIPLGVSRLSHLVTTDPLRTREREALQVRVAEALAPVLAPVREAAPAATVAVGGTVRALARVVAASADVWLPTTLNQLRVGTGDLRRARDELVALDLDGRAAVPGVKERRADQLHVAAVILTAVLEGLDVAEVTVSDWGLREGILLDAHGVATPPAPIELRTAEITRLRRAFPTDDRHLDHLVDLVLELFDRLGSVHGLGPDARELLVHATRLHDIGETLALRRHPVHGAYLVANAELRGFGPHEVAMLATLVRYHRSRGIDRRHPPFAALSPDDQERTLRLLPLLRLADRFDRTGDRGTRDVSVGRDGDAVVLTPIGADLPITPLEIDRLADLFASTYGVPLRFACTLPTTTA